MQDLLPTVLASYTDETDLHELESSLLKAYQANILVATAFVKDCETIFTACQASKSVLDKYTTALEKCQTDLKTLGKPKAFIEAYPKILREINRRKAFNQYIEKLTGKGGLISDVSEMIIKEKNERQAFLKQYGDVIPLDFIPQLKLQPHKLPLEILDP